MNDDETSLIDAPLPPRTKVRFQGHNLLNDIIRSDWIRAIELDPYYIEAYLYRSSISLDSDGDDGDGDYQEETTLELRTNQDSLRYHDPVFIKLLDCPDDSDHFFAMDDNSENLSIGEQVMVVRIAAFDIPVGSVLVWDEEISTGDIRTVWWYVLSAKSYGTSTVGMVYCLVPMPDFEHVVQDKLISKELIESQLVDKTEVVKTTGTELNIFGHVVIDSKEAVNQEVVNTELPKTTVETTGTEPTLTNTELESKNNQVTQSVTEPQVIDASIIEPATSIIEPSLIEEASGLIRL